MRISPPSLAYRLYKMSSFSGIVLVLPLLLGTAWYAWSAFARIDLYRRSSKDAVPLDGELMQIALHDELVRDWRRLLLPQRPADSPLRTLEISLPRESLDALDATGARQDGAGYVKGFLRSGGHMYEARLRYRGGQHWHWIGEQKSMKVRLDRGDLLDGTRVFNLLNDVSPFGLEEELILGIAREMGLLTPEYFPVWVRINNSDMGIYRFEAQPEEGLLRRSRRMPGSMYSGDSDAPSPSGDAAGLFWDNASWSKVASKDEAHQEDRSEIDRFLHAVTAASQREFADYAASEIDLERYAAFDALDVVFGGNDHDSSNHKLYFDSYRGKLEPVAWSFRAFQHKPRLNLVDHPLLVRLKMTPGYLALRSRAVYDLLVGKAAVPEVWARAERLFAEISPDLDSDPYWDAYKLLPRVTRFHRALVRPMSKDEWRLAAADELYGFRQRNRYLLGRLERPGLTATAGAAATHGTATLRVDADASYRLRSVTVAAPCAGGFSLYADDDRNGRLDVDHDTLVAHGPLRTTTSAAGRVDLAAGVRLVARDDPQPKHGTLSAEIEPRLYRYFATAERCAPRSVEMDLDNVTTGGSRRFEIDFTKTEDKAVVEAAPPLADTVPRFVAGEVSAHPWEFPPQPEATEVVLGPGRVSLTATRVFAASESVRIEPGTELLLGPGVALIFFGRLTVDGSRAAPVRVAPLVAGKPHGGLALQGKGTSGSRLSNLSIEGGTATRFGSVDYTGVVNINDTADIELDDLVIRDATGVGDALHATYVKDLRLREVTVHQPPVDAVDLEFTDAEIRGLRVFAAGDECVDLMGTKLRLDSSVLAGCAGNGISAGEETEVVAHGVLIANAKVGVLAKDASSVRLSRSLVYRSKTALQTHRRDVHYASRSTIGAQDLSVVACDAILDVADGTSIDPGFVETTFASSGLDYLREQVLRIGRWEELPEHLRMLGAEKTANP